MPRGGRPRQRLVLEGHRRTARPRSPGGDTGGSASAKTMNRVRRLAGPWSRTSRRKIVPTLDHRMRVDPVDARPRSRRSTGRRRPTPRRRARSTRWKKSLLEVGLAVAVEQRPGSPRLRTLPLVERSPQRAQSLATSCMAWVEKMIVLPRTRAVGDLLEDGASATRTSRPDVGSSKIRTRRVAGSIVRAIETFWAASRSTSSSRGRVAEVVHLEPAEDPLHPPVEVLVVHPVEPAEVFDQLPGGHPVVDPGVGRHEADLRPDLLRLRRDVVARDDRRPRGRPEDRA